MSGTVAANGEQRVVISPDPDATTSLGRALGAVAQPGDLVCLWGDLGAGKTHLAKAFGAGLGVTETITSPSFVLMAEYEGRLRLFDEAELAGLAAHWTERLALEAAA